MNIEDEAGISRLGLLDIEMRWGLSTLIVI